MKRKLTLLLTRNSGRICVFLLVIAVFYCVYSIFNRTGSVVYRKNRSLNALKCSDEEPIKVINYLCSAYEEKRITGNMCDAICHGESMVFQKCLNSKDGKYALLVRCVDSCVERRTVPAVLKMMRVSGADLDHFLQNVEKQIRHQFSFIRVYDHDIHVLDHLISQSDVVRVLAERLDSEYGVRLADLNLPSFLWNVKNTDVRHETDEDAVSIRLVRTLWSLMAQSEYRVSTAYRGSDLFPDIFGFCGPLYLSEFAPFDSRLDRRLPGYDGNVSWDQRVSAAIQILKLVQLADSWETPVHLCDVKLPHFGLASDGTVKFTDADTVFTNKTLGRDLASPRCDQHDDCSFFDCKSWCRLPNGTCSPTRTNNNLQVICAKILRDEKSSVYEGVLSNPPPGVAHDLGTLLDRCAEDTVEYVDGIPMNTPGLHVLFQLQEFLTKSLNATGSHHG